MTIGINGYEAVVPRFGYDPKTGMPSRVGSGEYCFELLLNLNKLDKKNNYIIYLPQSPTSDLPKESEKWRYNIVKPRKAWTLFGLSLEFLLKRSKPDVFFSPTHYLPIFSPKKSVISILDVSYLRFPQLFKKSDLQQLTIWTKFSVKKAKKVFTISQASKDDIIEEYGVSKDKIIVTYPGIKSEIQNLKSETNSKFKMQNSKLLSGKYGINGEYVLFVGTLQPRKNIARLIEAFSRACHPELVSGSQSSRDSDLRQNDMSLVIIGKKGWQYEEILSAPKRFNIENKVKFLENVTDEDLSSFYKNALCFILPSLYEGFGLPVLEAMQYGCPVITSNVSSLPEAGGDAALYVDPLSVDDITKKLELIIRDEGLREKLIKKGYERVRKFSWEKTARETLRALESIK
ncbi:MAG: glycosyltransferase family 4 protein [Candidatus Levybacteria bacterium]|nr:glycosyltransferase family 4 protein [Candidatus Levybacteria bacterium]